MNIKTLSYSEIQNLRIQAEIQSYNTGKEVSIYDVFNSNITPEPSTVSVRKPLPFFVEERKNIAPKRSNVGKIVRLKNHDNNSLMNFTLVEDSTLIAPERNIISIQSPIGKKIQFARRGDNFCINNVDYTIVDIYPPPIARLTEN